MSFTDRNGKFTGEQISLLVGYVIAGSLIIAYFAFPLALIMLISPNRGLFEWIVAIWAIPVLPVALVAGFVVLFQRLKKASS